jgi:hypothetical protein
MRQAQDMRRQQKEEELAQDRRMLAALRTSPNRHVHLRAGNGGGGGSPPPYAAAGPEGYATAAMDAPMTSYPPALAGVHGTTADVPTLGHTLDSTQENTSAALNRCVRRVAAGHGPALHH